MNNKLPDYYKILGVDRLADDKEIERAFRQKAMQCHPDRFSDPKEKIQKTKEFQTINEAYTLLSKYVKRKDYDAALERQDREEQERRARERQEKEERERRARKEEAQNQGSSFGFELNGFWFETMNFIYRDESASVEEIKRPFTSSEQMERVNRVMKPFAEGGPFFDATRPIGDASMTVLLTGKDLIGELLFTKNGAYNYSWTGIFQMRGYRGSAARFMIRDFKALVNSAYNTVMDWATEIVQNGHPATEASADDEWDEEEPEEPEEDELDEEEPESYQEEAPEEDFYDEGEIENEKKYPEVEALRGVLLLVGSTVPFLFFSVLAFYAGIAALGVIFLLFAIFVCGFLFWACKSSGDFDYFKKTKPEPAPAKPKPASAKPNPTPAKPQAAKQATATAPDAPIEWGWALVGALALLLVCMLIGGREGMLLFGVVVGLSSFLGLVVLITK